MRAIEKSASLHAKPIEQTRSGRRSNEEPKPKKVVTAATILPPRGGAGEASMTVQPIWGLPRRRSNSEVQPSVETHSLDDFRAGEAIQAAQPIGPTPRRQSSEAAQKKSATQCVSGGNRAGEAIESMQPRPQTPRRQSNSKAIEKSANRRAKPTDVTRSGRRSNAAMKPSRPLTAATLLPSQGGAGEASLEPQPTELAPRRQSSEAAQVDRAAHLRRGGNRAGEAIRCLQPIPRLPRRRSNSEVQDSRETQDLSDFRGGGGAQPAHDHYGDASPVAATLPSRDGGNDGAQKLYATHIIDSPVIAEIIPIWRQRQRWHRAEKSLTLAAKACCRGWTRGDKKAANALFAKAKKGGKVDADIADVLAPFLSAIKGFEPGRKLLEKRLKQWATELPVWPWVASVRGFGPLNCVGIVGEAGDVGSYRNPSCLWKRMGLAVIDGGRQRKMKNKEEAALHGYNPKRHAVAYLLGESLIKAGHNRELYKARRARTAETHPDWTKKHSHHDAMRIVTKRVLLNLWVEWRRIAKLKP